MKRVIITISVIAVLMTMLSVMWMPNILSATAAGDEQSLLPQMWYEFVTRTGGQNGTESIYINPLEDGGFEFVSDPGGWPSAIYEQYPESDWAELNTQDPGCYLSWDFEVVSGGANILVYFAGCSPYDTDPPVGAVESINYYIDPFTNSAATHATKDLPPGHYRGSVHASDTGILEKFTEDGIYHISAIKIFAVNGTVRVHDLSVTTESYGESGGDHVVRPTEDFTDTVVVHGQGGDGNYTTTVAPATTTVYPGWTTTTTKYDPYKALYSTPTTCTKQEGHDGWYGDYAQTTAAPNSGSNTTIVTKQANGFTYYAVSNTEAVVCSYTGTSADVVIPSKLGNYKTVGINDDAFEGHTGIKTVSVPSSVGYIGSDAFRKCTSLASVSLAEGLHTICAGAFDDCTSLTSIAIPEGVTVLNRAFWGCTGLSEIDLPDSLLSVSASMFDDTPLYTDLANWDGGVFYVDDHLIKAYGSLRRYDVREGTRVINANAFRYKTIETITFPDSLVAIGGGAFYECNNLSYMNIPGHVCTVGGGAFKYCNNMSVVILQEGVEVIGNEAFAECGGYHDYYDETTGNWIWYNGLEHVSLPGSLKTVADAAFGDTHVAHLSFVGSKAEYKVWDAKLPVTDVLHVDENPTNITVTHNTNCYDQYGGNGTVHCATCAKTVGYFSEISDRHSFNGIDCENCGILVETCFKSSHPYANASDAVWTLRQDGVKAMKVTFSAETMVEDGYDFITLYHADGTEIGTYTGAQLANQTVLVRGDRFMLRLKSDNSYDDYGFDVVSVIPTEIIEEGAEIGDLNGDSRLDMRDAFALYIAMSGGVALTDDQKLVADMNGDGKWDMRDAFALYIIASGG